MLKYFIFSLFLFSNLSNANGLNFINSSKNSHPLPVEEAFQPEINLLEKEFQVNFNVQPKHYLYKDKIKLFVNEEEVLLNKKEGILKDDPLFGKVFIYENFTTFKTNINSDKEKLNITLKYQGCSEEFKICYPPEEYTVVKNNKYIKEFKSEKLENIIDYKDILNNQSDANKISNYINNQEPLFIILIFLLLGLLMAFTPCVFPLVPIISAIVVKHDKKHPLIVSSLYVFGIGLCYSAIGIIINLFDFNIQIALQNIYFLWATAIFIFILALSMFGVINLRVPNFIQNKIQEKNKKLDNNKHYYSVVLSGFLSALILSPCAIAPLAGALLFASQYDSIYFSSIILFALGLGSGIPLIIFSSSLKKILPKTGIWMYEVKNGIGMMMIFISYYLVSKIIPLSSNDFSSSLFKVIIFSTLIAYLLKFISLDFKSKSILFIISVILLLSNFNNNIEQKNLENIKDNFEILKNIKDLKINKKTLVYVGADWCVACKQMEKLTFKNEEVINKLKEFKIYYVDITELSNEEKIILNKYNLQIAPFYVLYDSEGTQSEEINIGYLDKNKFLEILNKIN